MTKKRVQEVKPKIKTVKNKEFYIRKTHAFNWM